MRGKVLALLGVIVTSLVLTGCESRVAYEPKSTSTLVLTPAERGPTTSIDLVTAVKLVLPGPDPASGYAWVLVGNNVIVLGQMDQLTYKPDPSSPAGGTTSIRFYAAKPGRSIVRFVLVRPDDKEAVPVERYSVLVIVKDE
jgi:predicted secreted protein